MIPQFKKLNPDEIELLCDVFPLITLLIGYADGKLDEDEIAWADKITQMRSYSQHESVHEYYEEVHDKFQEKLTNMQNSLPSDNEERLQAISQRLSGLNKILPKLDKVLAWRIYHNLLSFAEHIAKASGGFLGWNSISLEEKKLIKLEMIKPIVLEEEPKN